MLMKLINKLKEVGKDKVPVEKWYFLNNAGLFPSAREKTLNNFKSEVFPTENIDKTPTSKAIPEPSPKNLI